MPVSAGYGRDHGARFLGPYKPCGICGLEYPESEMTNQRGHLTCRECLDDPGVDELKSELSE